jgi:UDP-glucose 4-epimerase
MRVLITGGAGFIGSHLCDSLVATGNKVIILDNLSTGSRKNISHLEGKLDIHIGDIRDKELVANLVADCDLVLHMAAAVGINTILDNPIESISTNIYGSAVVLKAATEHNKRIIIASTSEIYGKNPNQPLSEKDDRIMGSPHNLRWSYSDAKALEEASGYFLYITKQLKISTVRFFNTVGPRQTGVYGMVIPRFVSSALQNEPLKVFGDGSQTRVFCHVNDSIRAVNLIANDDNCIGEVFNIGGKLEISILDLANMIIELLNSKSTITFISYENAYTKGFEEMLRRVPDISKIEKFVNWRPEIDLEQIILDVAHYTLREI